MIICQICNKKFERLISLSYHLITHKDISVKEYYDKYLKEDGGDLCKYCKKEKTRFKSIIVGYTPYCSSECWSMDNHGVEYYGLTKSKKMFAEAYKGKIELRVFTKDEKTCQLCGKHFNKIIGISKHLRACVKNIDHINTQQYYDKYLRKSKDEGICLNCKINKTKFRGLQIGYASFCGKKCGTEGRLKGFKSKNTQHCTTKIDPINCKLCEKELRNLKSIIAHLRFCKQNNENLNAIKYYERYLRKQDEGYCIICNRPTKLKSITDGYNRYCSPRCGNVKTVDYYKEKYPLFCKVEKIRNNNKYKGHCGIQVRCKQCKKWFVPNKHALSERIGTIEGLSEKTGLMSENNFYCSDECKQSCSVFGLRSDSMILSDIPYTDNELYIWRKEVFKRQIEEDRYNSCEICGETTDLHCHHEKPIKTHPHLSLDPDNGIILCKDCHYKNGHTGKCSTKHIAHKICY